jgi:hypothetical protein
LSGFAIATPVVMVAASRRPVAIAMPERISRFVMLLSLAIYAG